MTDEQLLKRIEALEKEVEYLRKLAHNHTTPINAYPPGYIPPPPSVWPATWQYTITPNT